MPMTGFTVTGGGEAKRFDLDLTLNESDPVSWSVVAALSCRRNNGSTAPIKELPAKSIGVETKKATNHGRRFLKSVRCDWWSIDLITRRASEIRGEIRNL